MVAHMPSAELWRTLFLLAAYFGALAAFFAWCSRSRLRCVLPLDPRRGSGFEQNSLPGWPYVLFPSFLAVGVISAEAAISLYVAGIIIPGLKCSTIFWSFVECTQDELVNVDVCGPAIVSIGSVAVYLAARFSIKERPAFPSILFACGLLLFGAVCDVLSAISNPANVTLLLQLAMSVQLTAGAGFLFSLMILRPSSFLMAACGLVAYLVSAAVRTLGFAATLSMAKFLPAASGTALWIALMILPGMATALAPAAVMGVALAQRRYREG